MSGLSRAAVFLAFLAFTGGNLSSGAGKVVPGKSPLHVADPYILYDRCSGRYYAYGTDAPDGFRAYVSDDLSVWELADTPLGDGYVLRRGEGVYGNAFFWAPEVWKIGDRYYMLYTADYSLCVAESESPAGPFTQPSGIGRLVESAIDHTLAVDRNTGAMYLFFSSTRNGRNSIYMAEVSGDFRSVAPETSWIRCLTTGPGTWEETCNQIIEGPSVLMHDGRYYLVYSANDYRSKDYGVGYAVTESLQSGAWEKFLGNPVLQRKDGLSGTGHSSFFTGADGHMYMAFHAHPDPISSDPRVMHTVRVKFDRRGVLKVIGRSHAAVLCEHE